ncbi:hypothetical protein [Actinokineospora globicatena]|uniref:hypothetical protein n=1 Tax=Actinokineospora globicatena TaxID=103729 RepID=UPI002555821D|nr:hypothetical protein [Actinokineospora globicatena]
MTRTTDSCTIRAAVTARTAARHQTLSSAVKSLDEQRGRARGSGRTRLAEIREAMGESDRPLRAHEICRLSRR